MKTCLNCYREHNGRGDLCAACNNPHAKLDRQVHKCLDSQRSAHLELVDGIARSEDEGWFYDDGERES